MFKNFTRNSLWLFLFLLSTLVLTSCADGGKLQVYACPTVDDAYGCNSQCSIKKDLKYSFIVNKEEKSIFHVAYSEGKQYFSMARTDCTIFSEKNWQCSSAFEYAMTNGVFTLADKNKEDYLCAK